jgi:mannose-6-phosphate isomerase-like protein (cupin superfamily)
MEYLPNPCGVGGNINMINTNNHKYVHKGWGYELWITNTDKYCGKLLYIVKDKKLSWHYHKLKDEVMYVQEGTIIITYGHDQDISKAETIQLEVGDSFHIPVGLIHRISAVKNAQVFEFSTQHFDEDSIRLEKGD